MKIDDVYEEYINFTPLSPRTKSMYLKCYNNFWKNIIGHLDINELSYNIVQSGINFLIKKYSYNTIKIYKCAVFKFIDIAQLKMILNISVLNVSILANRLKRKNLTVLMN